MGVLKQTWWSHLVLHLAVQVRYFDLKEITITIYLLLYTVVAADFSLTTSMVTFDSNDMGGDMLCFEFNLIDDQILEDDEMFNMAIADAGGANLGTITMATVTIDDNDG